MTGWRLFAILPVLLLSACSALPPLIEKPIPKIERFSLEKINTRELEFTLTLSVSNPNAFSLTLSSVKAELQMADLVIAEGSSDSPVTLPGHGATSVELNVHSDLSRASKVLTDMLLHPSKKVPYHLSGEVRLTQLSISQDFDQKGEESLLTWFRHKKPSQSP
jgi:LEA14-like dessication related protein